MNFRTEILIQKSVWSIEHSNNIMTIGSCFAENISDCLTDHRFNVMGNPFGVLYNPVSIYNAVKLLAEKKFFELDDLIQHQDEYHSFFHHSNFSHHDPKVCLNKINDGLENTLDFLKKSNVLIITFGTAFVYRFIETGIIASNCHKIPAKKFERYKIGMYEAREFIQSTVELLREINPNLKIIMTLSPIRHWKDGAEENQLSKAILLLAIHEIINENNLINYFPSYEIMMDDLRDYRFYAEDLLHPNEIAINYIWQKFSDTYFSGNCKNINNFTSKISAAIKHRPRNIDSKQHQKFVSAQLQLIDDLTKKYPHLNLSQDKMMFESILHK